MPDRSTGYGIGAGRSGPTGNRNSSAIRALVPANTRPVSLRPGAVLVGTCHNFGTAALGAIPRNGATLLSPGTTLLRGGAPDPATWSQGDPAKFQGNGWLVTGANTGGGPTIAKFTVSSAEILDLVATPVPLIVAPTGNKFLEIEFVAYYTVFGTTAYVIDGGVALVYNAANPTPMFAASAADFTAALTTPEQVTGFAIGNTGSNVAGAPTDLLIDQGIDLANVGSTSITDGDSSLVIVIGYNTVTVPT